MKKKIIALLLAIFSVATIFSGCSEKEKTVPTISLISLDEYSNEIKIDADALIFDNEYVKAKLDFTDFISEDELLNSIELVIDNKNIAKIENVRLDSYNEYSTTCYIVYELTGVNNGKTVGRLQTKDGKIRSEDINITVDGVTTTTTQPNTENMTLEEYANYAIEKSNAKKESVDIVGNELRIKLFTQTGFSNSGTVRSMHLDAYRILQKLQSRDDVGTVVLSWDMKTNDVYGNETTINVMLMTINKDTLMKINFEAFDLNNIDIVADEYYLAAQLKE